jgi:hypothetical protein
MNLPAHITDDGIRQNLRRARDGSGEAMAYHYRVFLRDAGWIDERQNITATGLVELAKRERVMA